MKKMMMNMSELVNRSEAELKSLQFALSAALITLPAGSDFRVALEATLRNIQMVLAREPQNALRLPKTRRPNQAIYSPYAINNSIG